MNDYQKFIQQKAIIDLPTGFKCKESIIPKAMFEFQKDILRWQCRRGRSAEFADCGMMKTLNQLAFAQQVVEQTNKPFIIFAPLCVSQQTKREGEKFGIEVNLATKQSDVVKGINVTNYEKFHLFDIGEFKGVGLDESGILKSFDGATTEAMIDGFAKTQYKGAYTATPAPNDYMELGNHSEFLGVMRREEMLSMFFTHDGGETSKWRLKGHGETEFWKWLCSWAVNVRKPSDLGYDDKGFKLPSLNMFEHIVESESTKLDCYLFSMPASSLAERREARRCSLDERVDKICELANDDKDQWIVWCNLNSESEMLSDKINGAIEVTGSQDEKIKEANLKGFLDGTHRVLVTKPKIAGYGLNIQNCHNVAYCGLSDSYEDFYQTVRRCWRFGQKKPVNAHIVISHLEGAVLANIKRKEKDADRMANEMVKHMAEISSAEIKGLKRDFTEYKPKIKMQLPEFI